MREEREGQINRFYAQFWTKHQNINITSSSYANTTADSMILLVLLCGFCRTYDHISNRAHIPFSDFFYATSKFIKVEVGATNHI